MSEARKDIKDIMLREGVLSQTVLNEVLKEQEARRGTFMDALFRVGKFDEKKLVQLLTQHYGYRSINLTVFEIEDHIIECIPRELAEKHLVLPVTRHEHTLTVALADPNNLKVLDEVRAITGMRIKPVVAEVSHIKKYIEKYYGQRLPGEDKEGAAAGKEDKFDDLVKMIEVEHAGEGGDAAPAQTDELMKVASDTPVVKLVNMLLIEGIRRHASDIFIEPWERYVRVRARVDGLLEEVLKPPKTLGEAIVSRVKIMSELNIAEHRIPQDGRFKVKVNGREVDMRVSILPTSHGEKVCLRVLDTKAQSHDIAKLGFNEKEQQAIKDAAKHPHGMILVTGPTGSGKTTTLYSIVKYLDRPDVNLTTVEDPVEYQLPGINQVNVKDQIGLTFPASLRSILRQDPDIILIGEIRDNDTLDIAVKAALTGHLVLSTLHTNDAASSITRMVNMGLEPFLIASTVLMISAQRLVRRVCEKCREPEAVTKETVQMLGVDVGNKPTFYKGKGCNNCRYTGYAGRSVITELMQMTPEVKEMIMQGAPAEDIKQFAQTQEMTTLRQCAVKKALAGETSLEEVFRVTSVDFAGDESEEASEEDAKKPRKRSPKEKEVA